MALSVCVGYLEDKVMGLKHMSTQQQSPEVIDLTLNEEREYIDLTDRLMLEMELWVG